MKWSKRLADRVRLVARLAIYVGPILAATFSLHFNVLVLITGLILVFAGNILRDLADAQIVRNEMDARETLRREDEEAKKRTVERVLNSLVSEIFGRNAFYRATILLPNSDENYLIPRYRFQVGQSPDKPWKSTSRIAKGSAGAGLAWAEPGVLLAMDVPILPPDEREKYYREQLRMSTEDFRLMSELGTSARSILNYGLLRPGTHEFIGVLTVDSPKPNAFDNLREDQIVLFLKVLEAIM